MKVELSFTQTKIADLESKLKDKEQSLKIYAQKLQIMDGKRYDYFQEKYFPNNSDVNSASVTGSDCSCQINAKILRNSSQIQSSLARISDLEVEVSRLGSYHPIRSENTGLPVSEGHISPLTSDIPSSSSNMNHQAPASELPPTASSLDPCSSNRTVMSVSSSDHESDFEFEAPNHMNLN